MTCRPNGVEADPAVWANLRGHTVELLSGKGKYPRKPFQPDYQQQIADLHKQGLSYRQICEQMGISKLGHLTMGQPFPLKP